MELPIQTFIIVCPFLFLAGMVDAIGGGGGLIYRIPPFSHGPIENNVHPAAHHPSFIRFPCIKQETF